MPTQTLTDAERTALDKAKADEAAMLETHGDHPMTYRDTTRLFDAFITAIVKPVSARLDALEARMLAAEANSSVEGSPGHKTMLARMRAVETRGARGADHFGIYEHGRLYPKNALVTRDGSHFIALCDKPSGVPGTDSAVGMWKLCAKGAGR